MPAKLDSCVSKVKEQGRSESEAYAICSKSLGIVKTGKHTWGKKNNVDKTVENMMLLSEDTIKKVENLIDKTTEIPLELANKPLDFVERQADKLDKIGYMKDKLLADPTKLSRSTNAKEWAALMGLGSAAMHAPQLLSGDPTSMITAGTVALGNAAKGSLIGPMLTGGKDTLLKSTLIPAGVTAALTKPINDIAMHYLDLDPDDKVDFDSTSRAGLAGAFGGGMWALRNRKKENKNYV